MPFLIRIVIQRVAIFFLSFLAFLGINPDIQIPTIEELANLDKEQKQIVQNVLSPSTTEEKISKKISDIEGGVQEIAEEVSKRSTKTQETIENIINLPEVENTDTGIKIKHDFVEDVVVNIVCVNKTPGFISMSTGSGVIVSPSGLVLTNSHVANSFLFNDKNSKSYRECSVRRENIPTYGFNAELVYLPSDWLENNQSFFTSENPRGSGEDDYALIALTSNTNPALSIPEKFEYVNILKEENYITEKLPIIVAAYPGLNSGIFEIDSVGKLKTARSLIRELLTFERNTVDLISTEPNEVAKKGSSGGGVFWDEKLLGIVTTTDGNSSEAYINAITSPYIFRDFKRDTGKNLDSFVNTEKSVLISNFKSNENYLKSLIADFL